MAMTKRACTTTRERLFIIMEAHAQGWGFAKTLNFYQEGIHIVVSVVCVEFYLALMSYFRWRG